MRINGTKQNFNSIKAINPELKTLKQVGLNALNKAALSKKDLEDVAKALGIDVKTENSDKPQTKADVLERISPALNHLEREMRCSDIVKLSDSYFEKQKNEQNKQ